MSLPAQLTRALRASIALRDKLVLVRAGAASEALAEELALLRSLGARVALVCREGEGDALCAALGKAGERPAPLSGGALVKAAVPGGLPIVEGILPGQLGALGWLPVITAAPAASMSADLFAAGLAFCGGAERLVFHGGAPEAPVATLLGLFQRPFLEAQGSLLEALLLADAPRAGANGAHASAQPVITGAGAALLGGRT